MPFGFGDTTSRLARRAASGDRRAFRELYRALYPLVARYVRRRIREPADAEDIVARAFQRVVEKLDTFDPARGNAEAWALTITRNLVRNEYRRRDRKPVVSLDAGNHTEPAATDPEPASHDLEELNGVLGDLTDAQREAVVLRHVVGLPMREVALTMGCPDGTAKSHISRGLAQLRSTLDEKEASR